MHGKDCINIDAQEGAIVLRCQKIPTVRCKYKMLYGKHFGRTVFFFIYVL